MTMQHAKDVALLIVTAWAALVAGRMIAVMVLYFFPVPMQSDTAGLIIVCAPMLLTGIAAGVVTMTHLKWAARFQVLMVVPLCLAVAAIVAYALQLPGPMLSARLGSAAWAQLDLLTLAVGIIGGAVVRRYFGAAVSVPNKTMEPTR
jgi:hypothetical protein